MRGRRKNREAFAEHSFWQSYSDMMAALLLIFILIIAITLAIYQKKTTDLENTRLELVAAQEELDAAKLDLELSKAQNEQSNKELAASLADLQIAYEQAALTQEELRNAYLEIEGARNELTTTKEELENIVGIRTDIIATLQETFDHTGMTVDAQTGSITFSSDVLFEYNRSTLTSDSRSTIKNVIPRYLTVLLSDRYREYIAEIIIEGHTDTDGGYKGNMALSYERAKAVADFCMDSKNGLSQEQILHLQKILTINGKSCGSPVYRKGANQKDTKEIDMAASRRVEIKFRLKEDEMIQKISEILKQ